MIAQHGLDEAINVMKGKKTDAKVTAGAPDWIVEFELPAIPRRRVCQRFAREAQERAKKKKKEA